MKKVVVCALFATLIVGGLSSCKKVISKIFNGFDTNLPDIEFTIPALPVFTPLTPYEIAFPPFTQHFNLDSIIKANTGGAFGAADVSSVKIKKMIFSLKNADATNNLANFESLRFGLSSNSKPTVVNVATFAFPDTYSETHTYDAPSDAPELKSYLTGTELSYHSFVKVRRLTTKPLSVTVKVTITAN